MDDIKARIKRDTYKKLQQLKLDLDKKSISDVIDYLVNKELNK